MSTTQKKRTVSIVLMALIVVPFAELAREEIVYVLVSRRLESAYKQIEKQMIKEQIRSIAGEPDSIIVREGEETWYWDAMNHQGWLWQRIGLTWVKGHYGMSTRFNGEGRVSETWGGVN